MSQENVNADANVEGRMKGSVNADGNVEGRQTNVEPLQHHHQHQHQKCPACSSLHQHNHQHQIDPDEINLLEYIYVLVKHKWWIIGATVAGLLLGYVAALIKGPTWTATAVIAPKESDKGAPDVSGFGLLRGMVAGLLGVCGNGVLCPQY